MPQHRSQIDSTQHSHPTTRRGVAGDVCARPARAKRALAIALASIALAVLNGCGSAGGGASPAPESSVQTAPVYLTPGATSATMAWPPSEGAVESYLVFESRNGSLYEYSASSNTPSIDINGQAGDSVQITVVAVSPTGQFSDSSPPSPPMIFQDAPAEAAVAALPPGPASPTAAPVSGPAAMAATDDATAASADGFGNVPQEGDAVAATDDDANAQAISIERLAADVREMLVRSDARLPQTELSSDARGWLQARVDAEMSAGVRLAGTGRRDDDGLRELVWQDHAGQLFVSDGATAIDAADLPATFEEALRLRATERFVGLADLDGDGLGDWLVEDTATAEVFVVDGASQAAFAASALDAGAAFAGLGDFDGDGRGELLWRDPEGRLGLTRPTADAPMLEPDARTPDTPEHFAMLAIADFDGDGRDDLLGRDDAGALWVGLAVGDDGDAPITFEWTGAGAAPANESELVATLDSDGDGRAELAWLDVAEDAVDLRDVAN